MPETRYLKFSSESEAIAVLAQFRDAKGWVLASHRHALDPVGVIWRPTDVMIVDPEFREFPETAPLDGWHVNFIGALPIEAEAFEVFPSTPSRVFAE